MMSRRIRNSGGGNGNYYNRYNNNRNNNNQPPKQHFVQGRFNDGSGFIRKRNQNYKQDRYYNSRSFQQGVRNRTEEMGYNLTHGNNDDGLHWYKWTILFGERYDRSDLMEGLRQILTYNICCTNVATSSKNVVFYVNMSHRLVADTRKDLEKFVDPEGKRIMVTMEKVLEAAPPELSNETIVSVIKEAINKRFDSDTLSLNLSDMSNDKILSAKDILFQLSKTENVKFLVELLCENLTQLNQLDLSKNGLTNLIHFKGLFLKFSMLINLNISDNFLPEMTSIDAAMSASALQILNISQTTLHLRLKRNNKLEVLKCQMKKKFPQLMIINGEDVSNITSQGEIELPLTKIAYFPSEAVQGEIMAFVQKYLNLFDTDRKSLVNCYIDSSSFSLHCQNHYMSPLSHRKIAPAFYGTFNRNLLTAKNCMLGHLYKTGAMQITGMLQDLPKTQHILSDNSFFQIDVPVQNPNFIMIQFSGLLYEIVDDEKCLRSYSRTILLIPPLKVINDVLFITNPTKKMDNHIETLHISAAIVSNVNQNPSSNGPSVVVPPSSSIEIVSSSSSLEENKNTLVERLKTATGMNEPFCRKCLDDLNWDYEKSLATFNSLNQLGKLPASAFQ